MAVVVEVDDPRRDDVTALLCDHLRLMHDVTPAGGVFALDVDGLVDPSAGFVPCEPFGPYIGSATSTCMTLRLAEGVPP